MNAPTCTSADIVDTFDDSSDDSGDYETSNNVTQHSFEGEGIP